MTTRRIIIFGCSIWKTNQVKVAVILSRLSDKMNIFTLTTVVVFNAILVSSSTMTLHDYLEYISRYEPRTSHQVQRKPVFGSPMIRQYFDDEVVEPASQPLRPGYYDLASDPDPIIENLPPDHNNLGFLANLSEGQLHELIRQGIKYQEIADEMAEENEGVVQVGYNSSEELDIDSLNTEDASGNLFVIVDEVHEGENETKNGTNIDSNEEGTTDEGGVEFITTTQKTATKRSTTTTKDPTINRNPANTTVIKTTTMEPTPTFAQLSLTINSTTTLKPTTTAKSKTTTTKKPVSSKKTKPTKTTATIHSTTLHPLGNRISSVNALDETENFTPDEELTPDEIDEDIGTEDPDDVDETEEIEEFSPETDLEYTDYEEQTLIDPVPNKRPTVIRPLKPSKKPNRRPGRRPGRRPAKRPGWRPNRRPGKPIRILINRKEHKRRGNQRPFNIMINPTKWNIKPINQSKRPVKVGGALTMCPYECRKLFLESLNI